MESQKELFDIFKMVYYEPSEIIFPKQSKYNILLYRSISANFTRELKQALFAQTESSTLRLRCPYQRRNAFHAQRNTTTRVTTNVMQINPSVLRPYIGLPKLKTLCYVSYKELA